MKRLLVRCVCYLFLVLPVLGSGELRVKFDDIVLKSAGANFQLEITNAHSKEYVIKVTSAGVEHLVDKKYLPDVSQIDLETVHVMMNASPDLKSDPSHFSIIFKFGPSYYHGTREQPVLVQKACSIEFRNSKFNKTIFCIPRGEFKNQWRNIEMYENATYPNPEEELDIEKEFSRLSVKCPWD